MLDYILDEYTRLFTLRVRRRKNSLVVHHQTCPVCGRTLVNLYRKGGVWKCKKCWDNEEG